MEEMSLKEFKKKFMGKDSKWDFNKFGIICKKCKSNKIEFNGYIGGEYGYYDEFSITGKIIIKCHNCGNAHAIEDIAHAELNTDGEKRMEGN